MPTRTSRTDSDCVYLLPSSPPDLFALRAVLPLGEKDIITFTTLPTVPPIPLQISGKEMHNMFVQHTCRLADG